MVEADLHLLHLWLGDQAHVFLERQVAKCASDCQQAAQSSHQDLPPCLRIDHSYFLDPDHFALVVTAVLGRQLLESVVVE